MPQSADRVLRRLVDAGLLTTKEGTIELAHERLINDWPKLPLKTWLAQDATDRRLIDQLRQRVNDDTIPDGLLAQAEELLQRDQELAAEEPDSRSWCSVRGTESARASGDDVFSLAAHCSSHLLSLCVAGFAWVQRDEAINQTQLANEARKQANEEAKNAQQQADLAREQTRSAQRNRALMVAGWSMKETEAGRTERGLLLALAVDPERASRSNFDIIRRDEVPALTVALERAIYAGVDLRRFELGELGRASWSLDGRRIVTASD